ncbi:hypothetical protein HYE62_00015, partial [Aggregatibacter actinomycetemcomitans]|nr:hypothetical protein [Aggregatibacter actinomycetemcomitans]MBN6082636.1 hypothetical protein [Aggregatibacter actinomycetemcomitans]
FVKIDDNTLEIKEKRGFIYKLMAIFIILTFGYYQFLHPEYRQTTFDDLSFTFQPETRFKEEWIWAADFTKPGYTRYGETKEEYMAEMWELHKGRVWRG